MVYFWIFLLFVAVGNICAFIKKIVDYNGCICDDCSVKLRYKETFYNPSGAYQEIYECPNCGKEVQKP